MKEILNFINNNAIVASLITLFLSTVIQVFFRRSDRRYNEKQENKKNRRKELENKAEFIIDNNIEDDGTIPHIEIFMTDFNAKVINSKTDIEFYYSKDILNKKKYNHLKFYLKNIGNADINQLDICATAQKNTMLCQTDDIKFLAENKLVNYSYLFDRKIMKGKAIMIDIAYLPDSKICNTFSSELALIFRDSYGNLYEQPFFLQQKNLYEPRSITHKEYNIYTKPDTAIECFKNPWLWWFIIIVPKIDKICYN